MSAQTSPTALFSAEVRRFIQGLSQAPGELLNPVAFFVLSAAMFSVAAPAPGDALEAVAVLWVVIVFATLFATDSMYRRDFEDGTLEQLVHLAEPLFVVTLARIVVHWVVLTLLLLVAVPVAGAMLGVPGGELATVCLAVPISTLSLVALGSVGAGLTVGLGRSGVLLALLMLPLYVPTLIFAVAATAPGAAAGSAAWLWLAASVTLSVTISPFAAAGALRLGTEM